MFKKTTNPNPAPKTENTHRVAKIGIVGAAAALALSLTPLLGVGASAETSIGPSSCVRAVSDSGKFIGSSDGCKVNLGEPTAPEGSTPVAECSDADDAVASALATAQSKVAGLDASSAQFATAINQEVARSFRATGGSLTAGATTIKELKFDLDTDAAVEAICDGGDPLSVMAYKIDSTTPVNLTVPNIGKVAELQATLQGTRAGTPTSTVKYNQVREGVSLPIASSFTQPVARVVVDRIDALVKATA